MKKFVLATMITGFIFGVAVLCFWGYMFYAATQHTISFWIDIVDTSSVFIINPRLVKKLFIGGNSGN